MKLLIVEDKATMTVLYGKIIKNLNKNLDKNEAAIVPKFANDLVTAKALVERDNFDAAIVDLELSASTTAEGNDVLKAIVNRKRFPVFVYSAHLGDLDGTIEKSIFFETFEKTAVTFDTLVRKLKGIYDTGATRILGKSGLMEGFLDKIFWDHIAKSLDALTAKGITEKQLLRYVSAHLYEYLEQNDAGFEKYISDEVYIKPSIKTKVFTGSILKKSGTGERFIVLTPACDLDNDKIKNILLAKLNGLDAYPISKLMKDAKIVPNRRLGPVKRNVQEKKISDANAGLERIIHNNFSPRYYFLPRSTVFEGGLINFPDIEMVSVESVDSAFEILATVNAHFLKDIVARFAFYYSRQGAPNIAFDVEHFWLP